MSKKRVLAELFDRSRAELGAILGTLEPEIHQASEKTEPALLYVVDRGTMAELVALARRHDSEVSDIASAEEFASGEGAAEERRKRFVKRHDFSHVAKLINPDASVNSYSVHDEVRFKQVNDQQKVLARLGEELRVWANAYRLHAKSKLESASERAEIERKIVEAEKAVARIMEEPSRFEVRVISKDRANIYSTLSYTIDVDGKRASRSRHLSIKMPNVLWYEPFVYRPNDTVSEFKKKAEQLGHHFGDVYFLEKEEDE